MDFQILLEGTMAGAEVSALTEAVSIDFSGAHEAKNSLEFKKAIKEPFEKLYGQLGGYLQAVKKVVVKDVKIVRENGADLNTSALKRLARGMDRFGVRKFNPNNLADGLEAVYGAAKGFRAVILERKTAIEKEIEKYDKALKEKAKNAKKETNGAVEIKGIPSEAPKTYGKKQLEEGTKLSKAIAKIVEDINQDIEIFEMFITEANKVIIEANKYINGTKLEKLPRFEDYVDGKIVSEIKKSKEVEKVGGVIEKLKTKFNNLIEQISKQINDPSLGGVAVLVAVAVVAYLVLYGVVKSSGGKVGNPAAVGTTIKAAVEVVKTGTPGKKILVLVLSGIFTATVAVAGKAGYNYIKKLLENKG